MSTASIIVFKDGKPYEEMSYGNAWGGAYRIWSTVFDRHLKDPNVEYDNFLSATSGVSAQSNKRDVWGVWKRPELSPAVKAVWLCTFDDVLIAPECFARFAADLREFDRLYPFTGVNHIPALADLVESLPDTGPIGFHHTSVSECPWWSYDDDRMVPYELSTGTKHWSLYEELDQFLKGGK